LLFMANNPLPWPQITHLPGYYQSLLEAHILYRTDPQCDNPRVRHPLSKQQLDELLFEKIWFANVKYDGTNVAIAKDGSMYGRRKQIESNSYQKTDLEFLKAIDINPLFEEMIGPHQDKIGRFFVYGELMINQLFDYAAKGMFKKWFGFGICIDANSDENGDMLREYLQEQGFRCCLGYDHEGSSKSKVTVILNQKLRNLFEKNNIPVAETLFHGSLHDLILQCGDWMIAGNGEGLVCVCTEFQKKWKIGAETQPSVFDALEVTMEKLLAFDDIDPRISDAVAILFQVTKSKAKMGKLPTKQKKAPKSKTSLFDDNQMSGAIESALSKYDSLDTYFESNKRDEIISLVLQEVKDDLLPLVNEAQQDRAIKTISGAVRKHIGASFGKWKMRQ